MTDLTGADIASIPPAPLEQRPLELHDAKMRPQNFSVGTFLSPSISPISLVPKLAGKEIAAVEG